MNELGFFLLGALYVIAGIDAIGSEQGLANWLEKAEEYSFYLAIALWPLLLLAYYLRLWRPRG